MHVLGALVCVCLQFYFSACFNITYQYVNTLLPWSSSCIRISTTFTEEAYKFSHEDNISKNEPLTIPGVCITARINKPSLNWVNAVRKMVARRGFLFSLSFLLRLEPCGAQQQMLWLFVPDSSQFGH